MGIVAPGIAAAVYGNLPLLHTGWILWTLVLFISSGLIYALRVAPLQKELSALAEVANAAAGFDFDRYHGLAKRWEAWGAAALLTPLAGLALMVLKLVF